MKKVVSTLLLILLAAIAYAVPAKRTPFTVVQSDGTRLTLVLVGDEHLHYYENVATGEKMLRGEDGDYYVVGETQLETRQQAASARRTAANQRRMKRMHGGPAKVRSFNNMTGRKKGIVILVNFANKTMTTGTQTTFNNMFNQEGYNQDGHIGSVADYFKAQSYGQFELSFDVVGPVTLSQNMAYYGGNNSNGNDQNPGAMVKEACELVNSQVNFADYDWTGDGYVDQVFVIYAGYGENYSGADENTIWPHEWDLRSATGSNLTLDGKTISTYACCAELYSTSGTTLNGMGTACHEFSHCLGYPDSYDIDYSGGIGMDSYDVMCGGSYNGPNLRGEVPAGYTAYQRWMAGWLEPTELSEAANVTDMKDLGTEGEAYIIYNNSNRNEYFLLENRQAKDWFRYYNYNVAGHGLFITHIDYNSTVWSNNKPNDDPDHQRMTWVPADKNYGSYDSNYASWSITSANQKGDYFPGTSNVRSFKPTASAWNTTGGKWFTAESGSYYTSHELSGITENTTTGTISFLFDGGDNGTRYTVTYNAGGGSCATPSWTQTTSSRQSTTLPACTIESDEWSFAGWTTASVAETTTKPGTLLKAGDSYTPTADVTLYAVYSKNEAGGTTYYATSPSLNVLPTATISLNAACHDTDGMVYSTYSNDCAWVVSEELIVAEVGVEDGKLVVVAYGTGDIVPANTGVMVSGIEGGNYTVALTTDEGSHPAGVTNCLRPSGNAGMTATAMADAAADCTYYRLTMHNGETIGFWWGAEDGAAFSLAANKAYLAVPKSAGSNLRLWLGDDDVTAIDTVVTTSRDAIYNLQGQRMNRLQQGVNIVNGRRVIR